MSDETRRPPSANDFPQNTALCSESQAAPGQTPKHQQIESKQIAHDITFERALTEWIINRRTKWCKNRQPEHS